MLAGRAHADEGGANIYLLGSGSPGAAELPPLEGLFLFNTYYYYDGKANADGQFPVGGNLVAGLRGTINADFLTLLWVPTTNLAGGTLAVGGAMPLGAAAVDVSAVITGPRGRTFAIDQRQSSLLFGDPLLSAAWGWKDGRGAVQLSTFVNVPIGDYREGDLSNMAFNRWATDASLAGTWHDDQTGWDLSGKAGVTFNGENHATDYISGNDFHLEGSVEKTLSPAFSLGVQAYYFKQITGDSGPGAVLGPFKGEVSGVGVTGAYNFTVTGSPASLRLHAFTEFDARNRLKGNAVFLDFSMPLYMKLPPGAGR